MSNHDEQSDDGKNGFSKELIEALSGPGFISPMTTDPDEIRELERRRRILRAEIRPFIDASRRAERPTADDLFRQIGKNPSFGIGGEFGK